MSFAWSPFRTPDNGGFAGRLAIRSARNGYSVTLLSRREPAEPAVLWWGSFQCGGSRAGRGPLSGHQDDLAEGGPAGGLGQFHGRGCLRFTRSFCAEPLRKCAAI